MYSWGSMCIQPSNLRIKVWVSNGYKTKIHLIYKIIFVIYFSDLKGLQRVHWVLRRFDLPCFNAIFRWTWWNVVVLRNNKFSRLVLVCGHFQEKFYQIKIYRFSKKISIWRQVNEWRTKFLKYHAVRKRWTLNAGNCISRHCLKYARIRVFTDPYPPV